MACQPAGLSFPKGFFFGTSIAGFQGDMGCPTLSAEQCEDRNSDWYQWTQSKELQETGGKDEITGRRYSLASKAPLSESSGQWELYASDYALMKKELGVTAYRMSIEWSRIFPRSTEKVEGFEQLKALADPKALAQYHKMFQALRKQGIEPYVTLNHYTLPVWIHDGVACYKNLKTCKNKGWVDQKRIVREIAKYAGFVAKEFGAEVDMWITLNEPFAVVLPGYLLQTPDRINPPAVSLQFGAAKTVLHAMIEAHARMYDAIKKNDTVDANRDGKSTWIGIAYSFSPVYPLDANRERDRTAAQKMSYLINEVFMEAIVHGKLDVQLDGNQTDRPDLKRLDWLGVNYYMKVTVRGLGSPPLKALSPMFLADPFKLHYAPQHPKGMYDVLQLVKKYKKPIVITENGHDMPSQGRKADDSKMPHYIVRHLFWLHQAMQEGADVRGYLYWSFVDNFEWNHGFDLRFGLFAFDPKDKMKKRIPRSGVKTYRSIIEQHAISPEQIELYLTDAEKKRIQK